MSPRREVEERLLELAHGRSERADPHAGGDELREQIGGGFVAEHGDDGIRPVEDNLVAVVSGVDECLLEAQPIRAGDAPRAGALAGGGDGFG